MARAPDKRIDEAYKLYKQGYKLIDIANKLNVPAGTVRRWKCTGDWDKKKPNERSKKNSERSVKTNERNKKVKQAVASEVESVMSNSDLNDKQRLFCLYFAKCFNATKSYQKAYGCTYETAMANGSELLRRTKIKEQITLLKQEKLNREFLSEHDIFQKYMDIAYADINDFVKVNGMFVQAKGEIDGTIVSEISATQNGIKIKLADRMKALDWLTAHMNMATDEQKAKLNLMQAQIDKLQGTDNDKELEKLDEVLDSIKGVV